MRLCNPHHQRCFSKVGCVLCRGQRFLPRCLLILLDFGHSWLLPDCFAMALQAVVHYLRVLC